ncbi:beta subunit of clathrin adaptor protein AP3, partial [Thalassiosira pseudonana CCMP1335]
TSTTCTVAMDWSTANPIPASAMADAANAASSALSSISESTSGLYNSTLVSSAMSTIGDAQFFEESISPSTVRTHTTLNLLKGMKWLLANMSKGRNVSDFFPHVVKLVGAPNLEVRKMVYIYLARYANHDAQCREMALLSINAFQRGLADREPLLRSLALRVLTCMDVPDVLQLQIMGVQTCCKDSSPYVRKCAANAVGKLHPRCLVVGDGAQAEQLINIITKLLEEDGSTMVLTSAMIAFCEICPQRLELLHGCYRKMCHLLTDMDEWGQVMVMDALTRYCRTFFKQPRGQMKGSAERIDRERRVTRSTRKMGSQVGSGVETEIARFDDDEDNDLDEDHKLLLDSSFSLLKSRNSAVVLAVCSLHYYCGIASIKIRTALGKALVRIHRDRREIQYVVLVSIRTLVQECPSAFTPFLNDFFVKGMDPSFTRMIKLDILVSLCIDPAAIDAVLSELRTYVRHNDKPFACAAIRAVGKDSDCARADANLIALNCLSGLVSLSEFSKNDLVVGECAETIQRILSQLWSKDTELKMQLVNDPAKVQEHAAVASTLWLVSEWATMTEAKAVIRLEILRLLASSFSELDPQIKLQGVHLSSKVLLMLKTEQSSPATADKEGALCEFILAMGRIDVLQDVRDRSRYESNILHASIILTRDTSTLQSAPEGSTLSDDKAKSIVQAETDMFRFGTLSSVMSSRTSVSGLPLPKWANVNSSGSLRDQSVDNVDGTAGSNNEDMYSSSSEEDSSSSSSSSSAGDSSSSEESDSDEESTSGSDDSTVEDKPVTLDAFGSNGFGINPTIPVPTQRNNTQVASLLNNDTDDSSSSSSDYDSDSSSESDDSSKEVVPAQPSVGNIFDMDSVPSNAVPVQYAKQVSNGSSVAAGLEDLIMTPLVVDRDDADVSSNGSNESGPWIEFVKSELAGGLSVRMRFVHGRSRIKEAKMMGLDSDNTSTVCLQAHIENK